MRFKHFFESLWGGDLKYKLPKDKEQQLYDFYMYTVLLKTGDMQADYVVNEISDVLLPNLKQNLLDAVLFAISAEVRHINTTHSKSKIPIAELLENEIGSSYAVMYKNYIKSLKMDDFELRLNDEDLDEFLSRENFRPKLDYRNRQLGDSESYQDSYQAMRKATKNVKDFVTMSKFLFTTDQIQWDSQYGGESWGRICDAWLKLYNAESKPEIMIWIDHVYDLQHNTDTVFNKLKTYYKNGYSWLKRALDLKATIKDPHQLYPYISDQLKPLAARLLKIKYNKSVNNTDNVLKDFIIRKYAEPNYFNYFKDLKSINIFIIIELINNWVKEKNYTNIKQDFKSCLKELNYEEGSLLEAIYFYSKKDQNLIAPKMPSNVAGFNLEKNNNSVIIKYFVYSEGSLPDWFNQEFSIVRPIDFGSILQAIQTKDKQAVYSALVKQIGYKHNKDNVMIFCDYLVNLN